MITLEVADLFCGCGGASTGLLQAADALGIKINLVAVNHWPVAVQTHTANHPGVTHFCEDLETVNPRKAVPGGHLHLLIAAPECTGHSNAAGGGPKNDQSRATAWHVLRWAEALNPDNILIENVQEFKKWGPLYPKGHPLEFKPIPEKKTEFYRLFLSNLRKLGYSVGERVLNAANYGDATTRHRLFIQARRKDLPGRIRWPEPTHGMTDGLGLFPASLPVRTARDIINWDVAGTSIYGRKKPLKPNTMKRILAGLEKFCGLPFVLGQQSCAAPRSTDFPLPTVATAGAISLVQPFLVGAGGPSGAAHPQSVDAPLGTVLAENHRALVEPFLVVFRANQGARSLEETVPTITTDGGFGLCEPYIVTLTHSGGPDRVCDIDTPLPTVTTAHRGEFALCEPYLTVLRNHADAQEIDKPLPTLCAGGGHVGVCEPFIMVNRTHHTPASIDEPLRTLTTGQNMGLCEPFLVTYHGEQTGQQPRTRSVDLPLNTVDTSNRVGLAQPFLINYHGNGQAYSVDQPLGTVDCWDRYALVSPELVAAGLVDKGDVVGWLDIRFRMLRWDELAAAHSFPADYEFAGTGEHKVKQIGNSWGVKQGEALCRTILEGYA